MTFFDCTADLVGQLNGIDRKELMLQIDAPLSKIYGYTTVCRIHVTRNFKF